MTPSLVDLLTRSRQPVKAVERAQLQLVTIKLPPLKRKALLAALRLQLLPFMPANAAYAFVCRPLKDGEVQVWAWALDEDAQSAEVRNQWPEPLLEEAGTGLRLIQRGSGAEAQCWHNGTLHQSRWWPRPPSAQDWERFVRAAGEDPDRHPLAATVRPAKLAKPDLDWWRDDTLPTADPWANWRWQAALLGLGAVFAFAVGVHLQTRQQLEHDRSLAAQLRNQRQTALTERARYQALRADYEALSALSPKVSQLELLDKVIGSGVLNPAPTRSDPQVQGGSNAPPGSAAAAGISAPPPGYVAPAPTPPILAEWDYRNGQLKLSLDIPEGELAMLDTTRRIEKLPAFGDVRIGLESNNTSLSLSMRVLDAGTGAAR